MNVEKIEQMGSKPIAGDNPAGSKVDYDDDFQQLKEQLRKFGPGPNDPGYGSDPQSTNLNEFEDWRWRQIVKLGSNILSTRSKDLRVATYVTRGVAAHDFLQWNAQNALQ